MTEPKSAPERIWAHLGGHEAGTWVSRDETDQSAPEDRLTEYAILPPGHVIVPVEPTIEMIDAALDAERVTVCNDPECCPKLDWDEWDRKVMRAALRAAIGGASNG